MSSVAFDTPIEHPLIVALDVDTAEQSLRLAALLKGRVGALKIGPRLTMRYGTHLVERLKEFAPVFVDNKYLDTPNTMETAVRTTFESGATLTTVHAWGGVEALERLASLEAKCAKIRPFKILAVTILTSFSPQTLPPALQGIAIDRQVLDLSDLVLKTGLTGIVCSPLEAKALRARSREAFLVTPGIRLPTNQADDQKRIQTPAEAMRSGASALVVGRPICDAADPVVAAEEVLASIAQGRMS